LSIKEKVKPTGKLIIVKTDGAGNESVFEFNNLVVTAGREYIASRMASATDDVVSDMALGTGDTAVVLGDTTLETEIGRVELATVGGVHSGNTVTYSTTFVAGVATGAITEAGLFNDDTAGTMLARTVFPVINKQAADQIGVTWIVSIT
jgi:hypothetical protein